MSDYPQVSLLTASEELNRLHSGIESKMRSTVQDAIRAGEILVRIKEGLNHGEFLPWIKVNCNFVQSTAWQYMKAFEYRNKLSTVDNLQEAYKQVETFEAQAKQSEEQQTRQRITEYKKTGAKPDGWRRGTDDKLYQEEIDRDARIKKMQENIRIEDEKRQSQYSTKAEQGAAIDDAFSALGVMVEVAKKKQEFKERIRLSHEGKDDPFVDAIMDYLNGLTDDNRRVEACYNIIKVCKGIANQLQQGS